MTFAEAVADAKEFLVRSVQSTYEVLCELKKADYGEIYLLGAIHISLRQLVHLMSASQFGLAYTRYSPVNLDTTPIRIVSKEQSGRLRKVAISIDSPANGPTPTIRFGTSGVTSSTGGVRLNAGIVNELGEVAPDVELWAASSTPIAAYVIERA